MTRTAEHLALARRLDEIAAEPRAASVAHILIDRARALRSERATGTRVVRQARVPRLRRAVGARLRFVILNRDGFRCRYCGATPGETGLHVDHIVPASAGGTCDESNLVTACVDCNLGKSNRVAVAAAVLRVP